MNGREKRGPKKNRLFPGLLMICLVPLSAAAQDSHYWTHQYGTQANLLGGLVIGSVSGLAGTFYNPGSLPFIEQNQIILASKVFEYSDISLKNLAMTGRDLSYSDLGQAPTMLAGTIRLRGLGRHWLGFSYLTRQSVNYDISGTGTESLNLIPNAPGPQGVAVNYQLSERMTESWWGLTWAYKISPSLGVGLSQYITIRVHHLDVEAGSEVSLPDGHVALASGSTTSYYLNWRLLWKAGVIWDSPRLTLGATLTTPSLGLYGRGHTGVNNTAVGPKLNGDSSPDYVEADYQTGLKAGYRTPLSLGAGATFKLDSFRIYGSTEWFARVNRYAVMTGRNFVGQTSGVSIPNIVTSELTSVLNYGVGLEYLYRPDLKFYGSFLTDFTARPADTDTNLSPADWNIYEFVGGAAFKVRSSSFALGLGLGFGSRNIERGPGAFPAVPSLTIPGAAAGEKFSYASAKLILGFSF
jgi:hypothetical protein